MPEPESEAETWTGCPRRTFACGSFSVGGWMSLIVTLNDAWTEVFTASVAVQVTGVVPIGKVDPEAGLQLTL